jgi:hypothetical protein
VVAEARHPPVAELASEFDGRGREDHGHPSPTSAKAARGVRVCGACRTAIGTLLTDDDNLVERPTCPRAVKVLRLELGR